MGSGEEVHDEITAVRVKLDTLIKKVESGNMPEIGEFINNLTLIEARNILRIIAYSDWTVFYTKS
jgi:hypothetical protein